MIDEEEEIVDKICDIIDSVNNYGFDLKESVFKILNAIREFNKLGE